VIRNSGRAERVAADMPAPDLDAAVLAPGTEPLPDDHVRGAPDAPVTLLEYGDFECPYCAAAESVLRQLLDECEGRVRLVWRNFPLADVHPYALTAALAAEAAAGQGAFWPMHDLLVAHQDRLTDADLRGYAEEIGLDGAAVVGEAAQPFGDKVEADFAAGLLAGVTGTPALFVNGSRYSGRVEVGALRRAVGAALAVSGGVLSDGDPGLQPRPRRKRRAAFGLRRAQRETLPEEAQQEDAEQRGGE
jgi:protein-disulfide isomerase